MVTLRDVVESDLPILFEFQREPESNELAAFPPRDLDAFMAHRKKVIGTPGVTQKVIVADGQVVGDIEAWDQDGRRLIGYWVGRAHWGRGIATAALAGFLANHEKGRPAFALVALHNVGSLRVLEKCGFRRVGEPVTGDDGVEEVLMMLDRVRPPCIQHWTELVQGDDAHYPGSDELLSIGSPLGRAMGLTRLGVHHELLRPGRRTSWPHAERDEEEFVFVLEGTPDVWIDGHLFRLAPGDAVGFPAATGIAHTFLNNTADDVRLLVCGEASRKEHKVHYPLHPARNAAIGEGHWQDVPPRALGAHDGLPDALRQGRTAIPHVTTLETERLVLRPLEQVDAAALHGMRQHPEHVRYLLQAPPASLEESKQRMGDIVRQNVSGESKGWAILRKGSDEVRGMAGLVRIDRTNRRASLGYELRRQDWGSGIMREAVERIVAYGFDALNLHRIQAEIDPRNERSIRLVEALGFRLEGTLRGNSFHEGEFFDDAIYARLNPKSQGSPPRRL
jgi:RimJ/RimL family protein N-acetyltransferase/uncharacterized cupin superfamily protein